MPPTPPPPPPPPPPLQLTLPTPPALPPASTILVTGANGLIASHICDHLLAHGHRVRGAVRSLARSAWLAALLTARHGADAFSLIEVPDMAAPRAFDAAVRGVQGVAHVASVMLTQSEDDPGAVVRGTVGGTRELFGAVGRARAADGGKGVRRVVCTSSAVAARSMAAFAGEGAGRKVAVDEWNDEVVGMVEGGGLAEGGLGPAERVMAAYAAGKTAAERAVWAWAGAEGRERGVVVNTVVPSGVFGRPLSHEHQGYPSSSQWAPKAFTGDPDFKRFPTFYWINIKDMARLHVAALLHPEVKNERIFGFAGTYTMNEFLAFYRKHYPDREFPADIPGVECDLAEIEPAKRAEELLKEMGRPGYETLEDTVLDNIIDIA